MYWKMPILQGRSAQFSGEHLLTALCFCKNNRQYNDGHSWAHLCKTWKKIFLFHSSLHSSPQMEFSVHLPGKKGSWGCSSWKHDQFSSPLLTFNSLTLVILLPWYYLIVAVLVPLPPKPARWQHRAIPQSTGLWFLPDPCLVLSLINFRSSGCLSTCSQGVSSTLSRQSSSLPFDVC